MKNNQIYIKYDKIIKNLKNNQIIKIKNTLHPVTPMMHQPLDLNHQKKYTISKRAGTQRV